MALGNAAALSASMAERVLENEYAQDNLREGVEHLSAAYRRASKRRVRAVEDQKVREQLRQAAASMSEAASALSTGRHKPKRHRSRWLLAAASIGALGVAAAAATNDELMNELKSWFEDAGDGA
ncbi:MAG: hypothetical protein GEU88_10445 [Solirubrobacterales bacterium]|nr:hypothetical protein [Solirubrobacterales bacterium]